MSTIRSVAWAAGVLLLAVAAGPVQAQAGQAKGSVSYKGKSVTVRYAYLVKGPDAMTKQPVRRVILSATDLAAAIAKCKSMMCTDGDLGDGLSVNLDPGPRFGFWMVMNDQKVQYSGTEPVAALAITVDEGKRLAGRIAFDKTAAGGPKVDVTFDAALVKEVTAP